MTRNERANFGSKLGVILASAGSAVGLGNIWRFPFETGNHGGAAFILIYLVCVLILGIPIMIAEFLIGRRSRANTAGAYQKLAPGTHWRWVGRMGVLAGFLILGYYSVVAGWTLEFIGEAATNSFAGKSAAEFIASFNGFVSNPWRPVIWLVVFLLATHFIIIKGVEKGIEKSAKIMMPMLFILLVVLAICSVSLPGASAGIEFLLKPDFSKVDGNVFLGAMGQAFFTLSLGIGAIAIFGSYIGKERTLTGEAVCVTVLDTLVALIAGFIIFPACFAFNVQPDSGPSLIFITLPNIFNAMSAGRIWGTIFFLCMFFAACSTIIAVFENLIAFVMDLTNCSRTKAVVGNLIAIIVLSLPCIFGFNIWSGFMPLGAGSSIQDLEDFIVSNNLLPIGSLIYLLFCTSRYGWGWDKFQKEANAGSGIKFPGWARFYVSYILPLIVLFIFVQGYWSKFVG